MPARSHYPGPTRGPRRRFFEQLEDRRMLAFGDVLFTTVPEMTVEPRSGAFGSAVAANEDWILAGDFDASFGGQSEAGSVAVFDAHTGELQRRLGSPEAQYLEAFGGTLALEGNLAAIGAPWHDVETNHNEGIVYVMDASTGALVTTISNPTPDTNDYFGSQLALSGDYLLVSSAFDLTEQDCQGLVYVFNVHTGDLLHTLHNPGGSLEREGELDHFGAVVSASGDFALISAPGEDDVSVDRGIVYRFDLRTGELLQTIHSPDQYRFGVSLVLEGDRAIISHSSRSFEYRATTSGQDLEPTSVSYGRGQSIAIVGDRVFAAYEIPKDGESSQLYLTAYSSDGSQQEFPWPASRSRVRVPFGNALATSNGNLIVGHNWKVGIYSITGEAIQTLPSSVADSSRGGADVASNGEVVVVGVPGSYSTYGEGTFYSGAIEIYGAATGELRQRIRNPNPARDDQFGSAVAVSDEYIVVAGRRDRSGVYVFSAVSGELLHTLALPYGPAFSVAIANDTIAVGMPEAWLGGGWGSVSLYSASSGSLLRTLDGESAASYFYGHSVALEGDQLIVGLHYAAIVYDLTSELPGVILRPLETTYPLVSGPSGHSTLAVSNGIIAVAHASAVGLYDAESGEVIRSIPHPTSDEVDVAFEGTRLLVSTSGHDYVGAVLYDAATGLRLGELAPQFTAGYGFSVALTSDEAIVGSPYYSRTGHADVIDIVAGAASEFTVSENIEHLEGAEETFVAADFTFTPTEQPSPANGMLLVRRSAPDELQFWETLAFRSNGDGPGQVRFGATVTYGGLPVGTLSHSPGASSIHFNTNASVEVVQAIARRLSYRHTGDDPSPQPRWFDITLVNGEAGITTHRITLTVQPVNDAPTADLDSTGIAENATPGALVGSFSATDPDNVDGFSYTLVAGEGDQDNTLFTIDGDELRATGSLNFEDRDSHSIRVRTSDAGGGWTDQVFTIHVLDTNDAPQLDASLNPKLTTTSEDAPTPSSTLVSSLLTGAVTDPDANALRGIAVTGASSYHGVWQFSTNGGSTWQAMGDVSESAARLLPGWARVRFVPKADFNGTVKFYYRAWDQTQGQVGGTLSVAGNTGGTKSLSTAYENAALTVTPVNDPPKLGLGGTTGYARDSAAITLAAGALVSDIDSANFANGRLRVRITDGASTSNRLAIGSGFMVDANNNVLQGTTIIGKRVANGFGTNELVIAFNTNATPSVVQQLVRAITFKTVGGSAGQRKVVFTVSDGDGGLSAEALKTVNVS